jgi:hypothetical protein
MAAVASPNMASPVTSPQPTSAPSGIASSSVDAASQAGMSPLVPSPISRRTTLNNRPLSHVSRHRLSQHSTTSNGFGAPASLPPSSLSRPVSHLFPLHACNLPYTIIRDFAYSTSNPMHYGPPPEPSEPPSARLSDPAPLGEERMPWESWGTSNNDPDWDDWAHQPTQFADGPPWSEDEDLQSPVVSSRHRKSKASGGSALGARRRDENGAMIDPKSYDQERGGYYVGTTSDGSKRYYMEGSGEANGPGGEYVTYRTDNMAADDDGYHHGQPPRRFPDDGYRSDSDVSSPSSSSPYHREDQSRYSRDYQFTITSPDEEMHGKAVALFDFERENENELPLVEGQIIWVSYRHGQGWLVAKDPKTQENGLVPEAYVRLFRDIEGGMNSLTGICSDSPSVEASNGTPTTTTTTTTTTMTPTTATTTPIVTTAAAEATTTATTPATPAEQRLGTPPFGSAGHSPVATADSSQLHQSPHHGHHPSHHSHHSHHHSTASANGYHQPVVSTFSTSSKDLDPYPTNHLGIHAGQAPPQVVHYHGQRGGSQVGTPVLPNHNDTEQQLLPREALGDSAASAKQGGAPEQAQEEAPTMTQAQEQDQESSSASQAQDSDSPAPVDDAPNTTTLVQR